MMKESIRCASCGALLFKAETNAIAAAIEIKCRRCGAINTMRPVSPSTTVARTAEGK
ncbi:Com family DNA-binding transcriptional regulator [Sphingomonas cavernae]